jgi:hypothetical protein
MSQMRGEPVTATFLLTFPTNERARADPYAAGANFPDYQADTFDWQFGL